MMVLVLMDFRVRAICVLFGDSVSRLMVMLAWMLMLRLVRRVLSGV